MKNMDISLKNLDIYPSTPVYDPQCSRNWKGYHTYSDTRMIYVLEGSFVLNIDNHSYIVRQHEMALLPQGHTHSFWRSSDQKLSTIIFKFRVKCHGEELFHFLGLTEEQHVVRIPCEQVMFYYQQIMQPAGLSDNMPFRLSSCAGTAQICALYVQARIAMERTEATFADAIAYMENHITEDISLDTLAALYHLSPNYFGHEFKKITGIPPLKYFAQLRAKHAANLLKTTAMSVSEVALATGFTNIYYFQSFFEKHMGVHPDKYRHIFVAPEDLTYIYK